MIHRVETIKKTLINVKIFSNSNNKRFFKHIEKPSRRLGEDINNQGNVNLHNTWRTPENQ